MERAGWLRVAFKIEDVGAQGLDGAVETIDCVDDRGFGLGVLDQLGHALQAEANGEEVLDHRVVQVAGNALPVFDNRHPPQPILEASGSDCGPGDPAQRLDQYHILVGEPALLVGEVEIAEGSVANGHRDAEEGLHRWMVRWESRRCRDASRSRPGGSSC